MLVLVAARDHHECLPGDRNFAVEGELVAPIVLECHDPHCDMCRRAWVGLSSEVPSTTAMVVDLPHMTAGDLRRAVHDWLDNQGWVGATVQGCEEDGNDPVAAVAELVDAHVAEIETICAHYAVGTMVSRLGSLVAPRLIARAA